MELNLNRFSAMVNNIFSKPAISPIYQIVIYQEYTVLFSGTR